MDLSDGQSASGNPAGQAAAWKAQADSSYDSSMSKSSQAAGLQGLTRALSIARMEF